MVDHRFNPEEQEHDPRQSLLPEIAEGSRNFLPRPAMAKPKMVRVKLAKNHSQRNLPRTASDRFTRARQPQQKQLITSALILPLNSSSETMHLVEIAPASDPKKGFLQKIIQERKSKERDSTDQMVFTAATNP